LGGSAWIWLANISIFSALFINHKKSLISRWIKPFAIIAVPILFSFMVEYVAPFEDLFIKNPTQNFLLIQPNIDPYSEKFVDGTADKQLQKLFNLIEKNIDTAQNTIIVFPETALSTAIWLTNFNSDQQIIAVRNFLKKYPKAKLITGASLIEVYDSPKTPSANQLGNSNKYADVFNASVLMDTTISIQKYYKSKLVPGVERMPYPGFFKFLKPLLIDMGGASDNNGTQEERTNLIANKKNIAAMVCYESIYGSFVSGFVKNDANVLLIITNDGWWGNTPGYKQHFEFAKLRAIETRREVLQCANNGFSGVIDEYGNIISKTDYWKQAAINYKATMLNRKTFFVQYGNELEWLFVFLSLAIILFATFKKYFLKT
jgi:apolipoprotein N-acyltransferase